MLHLHFAPSLDLLVPELLAGMRKVWTDPFAPPAVIVPNPALGTWLKLRLADCPESDGRLDCAANLEMPTLERFLWNVLRPDDTMRLLDVSVLQQIICALLDENLLRRDPYGPLRDYLSTSTEEKTDPLKRVQLSARIAHQFLEYEYNRPSVWDGKRRDWRLPGIDASWLAGKNYFKDGAGHEEWQKDLYRRAHDCLSAAAGTRYLSLSGLYQLRRTTGLDNGVPWTVPPMSIFLFGVSKVSHFHRNTLVEISQMHGVEMKVFLTNPCAEFWEDVDTGRRPRRRWNSRSGTQEAGITSRSPDDYDKEELQGFVQLPRDQELLELWGNAGKENIFLWCPQAEWNFEYTCPEWVESERPETLLGAVQYALLRRQSALPLRQGGGAWNDDGSLQVLACPDRSREIEELRERILDLVDGKKIDKLNEVAVYLPDPGTYVPYLQRVFGAFRPGAPDHIPFTILGAPGSDSVFAQGMRVFLELIDGRFDRARVFELLRNPIVQASRKIAPDQLAVWEHWAEELGIYRGFNRSHRERMGDRGQTITDAHTFELGMARMLTGSLSAGPVELDYRLLDNSDISGAPARTLIPPFRDFDSSDPEQLEKFCVTVEELYKDLAQFNAGPVDLAFSEAVELLTGLVWSWFGEIADDAARSGAAEGRVRREFIDAVQSIGLQETLAERGRVPLKEFLALAGGCLPGEIKGVSAAWTGGITFAPLRPAMIVPHRVVFVLGLDAAAFPGTNEKSGWELLSRRRRLGDSDRVRDNRFAFLELLHAARERLICTFRSRDMQKEEELQPSSVVLELEAFLKNQGLIVRKNSGERCAIRRDIPWIVHESLDSIITSGRPHGSWSPVSIRLAGLSPQERVMHRHDLCGATQPGKPGAAGDPVLRTDIFSLRKFFANPLEYHLSRTLGIDLDDKADTMGATDEALDSGRLAISSLQKKVWKTLLRRVFPERKTDEEADAAALTVEAQSSAGCAYEEHIASGKSPEAQVCRMEKKALLEWARECAAETLGLKERFPDHRVLENADLSLGRKGVSGAWADNTGAYVIECRHGLALVPRGDAGGAVGIIDIRKKGKAADNPNLWCAGLLQWMAEKRRQGNLGIMLVQLNRGEGERNGTGSDCSMVKENCAAGRDLYRWLRGFLVEMLDRGCCDHLPFATVNKLFKDDWNNITADAVNGELESESSAYVCYLESFALTDARIPQVSDDELRKRAQDRFAPMLERWLHE